MHQSCQTRMSITLSDAEPLRVVPQAGVKGSWGGILKGALFLLVWSCGQPDCLAAASKDLGCVERMKIPGYSFIARRSPKGGTVRAVVTVGSAGKAGSIDFGTSDANLAEEVRGYLSSETKYSEGCEGKTVELLFTFRLEGEAEWTPPVFFEFRPPNHFIIKSRPRKPEYSR